MRTPNPLVVVAAVLYFLGIVVGAFLLETPLPLWLAALIWLVAGALLALAAKPSRWWVALGFLWLAVAWVEAGQVVWSTTKGTLEDVMVGCVSGAAGIGVVLAARAIRRPPSVPQVTEQRAAAPPGR